MKPSTRLLPAWSALALATAVSTLLSAAPLAAQGAARPSESGGPAREPSVGGGGGGGSNAGGGGGGSTATSGGSSSGGNSSSGGSSGGGGGFGGGSGARSQDGGGRSGATGGGGYAVPRGERHSGGGSGSGASGGAVERAPVTGSSGGSDRAVRRGEGSGRSGRTLDDTGVPAYARPRDGKEAVGTAVPRGTVPMTGGGLGDLIIPGGYYGGYYDPWWYGPGYVGSYGGYYDPWYGGYPSSQPYYSSSYDEDGKLRLKIKPRGAEVYVDGYFVGIVDDFDGIFQRLHLETGAHRVEVRAAGFEPLTIDVRITPEQTTTYQGELKRIQ